MPKKADCSYRNSSIDLIFQILKEKKKVSKSRLPIVDLYAKVAEFPSALQSLDLSVLIQQQTTTNGL